MKDTTKKEHRMVHYDLLRVFACFSVVMLHSAAQYWYTLPVTGTEWMVANSYDAAFRFGVPIFVMISGALFLNSQRQMNIKRLYKHNVLRIFVLYLVWSVIYGLFDCRLYDWSVLNADSVILEIVNNRYHLWFLPMIAGIYMLLPILKGWLSRASKKEVQYFLFLFLVLQIGKETVQALFRRELLSFLCGFIDVYMVAGYLGYFILGYYIAHYGIEKKWHKWIYAGGIAGVFANIVLGNILARRAGVPKAEIYDSFGLFTFLTVTALFLFFTEKMSKVNYSPRVSGFIREASMATLGIYLLHVGVIEFLQPFGIHSMMFSNLICIPVFAVGCFLVCFIIAVVVRRIPFVGRYIC